MLRLPCVAAFTFTAVLQTMAGCPLPLPDDVTITCTDPNECPPDFVCRLQVCQRIGEETEAPGVDPTSTIDPPLAGRDATVTVTLRATEALGAPPRLHVVFGDGRERELVLDDTVPFVAGDTRQAVGRFAVDASDVPGTAQVFVDLVDAVGNEANDVAVGVVGSLTIDTVNPRR